MYGLTLSFGGNMEKRNVYKVKSVCVPHMGDDRAVILDAQARERAYKESLKTVKRVEVYQDGKHVKAVFHKSEHGTINIGGK